MDLVSKQSVLALIREHLPFGTAVQEDIQEDSQLSELGLDSLHLITMLLMLQREYQIDMCSIAERGMPTTVSELLAVIQCSTLHTGPTAKVD
jgi:acyl carrier protein